MSGCFSDGTKMSHFNHVKTFALPALQLVNEGSSPLNPQVNTYLKIGNSKKIHPLRQPRPFLRHPTTLLED